MMIEKITPDENKAKALSKMANEILERVKIIPLELYPSPNLSDLYDVIHMLIESFLIKKGIKCRGESAHLELIEEAKNQQLILESERILLQQIRTIRNRHKYEGFSVTKEFVKRNEKKIFSIINKLKKQ